MGWPTQKFFLQQWLGNESVVVWVQSYINPPPIHGSELEQNFNNVFVKKCKDTINM